MRSPTPCSSWPEGGGASEIALPSRCPACRLPVPAHADCSGCGLPPRDRAALLQAACDAYDRARALAAEGRLREARESLRETRRLGLELHPAVERLDALCGAALGQWDTIDPAALPQSWRAAVRRGSGVRRLYRVARRAAARGAWARADEAATQCLTLAPWLLPARKLQLLALAAQGRRYTAERRRRAALALFPGEPDLSRWRFSPSPRRRRVLRRRCRRRLQPPQPQDRAQPTPSLVVRRVPMILAATLLAAFFVAVPRTLPPETEAPAPPVRLAATATPPPARRPATPWRRALDAAQAETTERLARGWFNAAVRARAAGQWRQAERLAEATAEAGSSTYLYEDALLMLAQLADNRSRSEALARYRRLLQECPGSPYAPMAQRALARLASMPASGNPK